MVVPSMRLDRFASVESESCSILVPYHLSSSKKNPAVHFRTCLRLEYTASVKPAELQWRVLATGRAPSYRARLYRMV